jgi:hypothetical protein
MARKPAINTNDIAALGAEKLARLVVEQAGRNPSFKKLVVAALAGAKGPKAVSAIIDRRIAALERARGFIEWEKVKAFAADLDMTVKSIVDELGAADPTAAFERMMRFIATHERVFDRVDDSQGRIQDVYETAIVALQPLSEAMADADRARIPDIVMEAVGQSTHGYFSTVAASVVRSIPPESLERWDTQLAAFQPETKPAKDRARDYAVDAVISGYVACRQAIADARGDLDGLIALEETKHPNLQNTFEIAERLRVAKRLEEALRWVRRTGGRSFGFTTHADLADGAGVRDAMSHKRVSLEARILEELGDKAAARALRWASFTTSLDARMLREHIDHLDDFEEFDELDRALDHASASPSSYRALSFFIEWPQLARAAELVIARHTEWKGGHYYLLVPAALALEDAHPVAATVLYRALLNDILSRAKSQAYGHGARYLARLESLATDTDRLASADIEKHATFKANLLKGHGRKSGFWALVRQGDN